MRNYSFENGSYGYRECRTGETTLKKVWLVVRKKVIFFHLTHPVMNLVGKKIIENKSEVNFHDEKSYKSLYEIIV